MTDIEAIETWVAQGGKLTKADARALVAEVRRLRAESLDFVRQRNAALKEVGVWRARTTGVEPGEIRGYLDAELGTHALCLRLAAAEGVNEKLRAQLATARREAQTLLDGMEVAWGVIANAGQGDWAREGREWADAAVRWRDEHWHPALDRRRLTQPAPATKTRAEAEAWVQQGEPVSGVLAWDRPVLAPAEPRWDCKRCRTVNIPAWLDNCDSCRAAKPADVETCGRCGNRGDDPEHDGPCGECGGRT